MCNNLLHPLCWNLSEWRMTLRIFLHSFHIQSISDLTWPQVTWRYWMVRNTKHQVTHTKAANHIHRILEAQWTDNVHCIPAPVVWMQIIQNQLKINQLEDSTHLRSPSQLVLLAFQLWLLMKKLYWSEWPICLTSCLGVRRETRQQCGGEDSTVYSQSHSPAPPEGGRHQTRQRQIPLSSFLQGEAASVSQNLFRSLANNNISDMCTVSFRYHNSEIINKSDSIVEINLFNSPALPEE